MRYTLPKSARLLRRGDFISVKRRSKSKVGKTILADIAFCQKNNSRLRLGIAVTKKYGNACQRNRFKRITREAFRLTQHGLPEGVSMIIRPRTHAKSASTDDIIQDLLSFFS